MRPKRLHGVVARALDVLQVGHVARDRDDLAAALQLAGGLLGEGLVAVPDRDRGAGIEEPLDDRPPDPLRAAGDDREAAGRDRSCWAWRVPRFGRRMN